MLFKFGFELGVLLLGLFDLIDHVTYEFAVAAVHIPAACAHHALASSGEAISIEDLVEAGDDTLCFHGGFVHIALAILVTGAKFVDPPTFGEALKTCETPREQALKLFKLVVAKVLLIMDIEQNV